jgi:hypothetical protein
MNIKEETKRIIRDVANGDMAYACLTRKAPGQLFPETAFVAYQYGETCVYRANIFSVLAGAELPTPKMYSSIDEIVADGWEVD